MTGKDLNTMAIDAVSTITIMKAELENASVAIQQRDKQIAELTEKVKVLNSDIADLNGAKAKPTTKKSK